MMEWDAELSSTAWSGALAVLEAEGREKYREQPPLPGCQACSGCEQMCDQCSWQAPFSPVHFSERERKKKNMIKHVISVHFLGSLGKKRLLISSLKVHVKMYQYGNMLDRLVQLMIPYWPLMKYPASNSQPRECKMIIIQSPLWSSFYTHELFT